MRHDLARPIHRLWATMLLLGATVALTQPTAGSADPGAPSVAPEAAAAAPEAPATATEARPGQWIQVDHQTGKRVAGSPSAAVAGRPEFGTSHAGLVEKPAAVPGGGTMIDVRGRFRSAATATVGADGNAHVDCLPPGTAAPAK